MSDLVTSYYDPKQASLMVRGLRHSAVARYLIYNCEVRSRRINANLTAKKETDPDRERLGSLASNHFIRLLPEATGVQERNILLILDADRQNSSQYPTGDSRSWFNLLREQLIKDAALTDINVLDLSGPFATHYRKNQEKFEFPTDPHWNILGHSVTAKAILESEFWLRSVRSDNKTR